MEDYAALKVEIAKPAYNGMTEDVIASTVNAASATAVDKTTVTGGELVSCLVKSEVVAMTVADRAYVQIVCNAPGSIPISSNFKAEMGAVFGVGTTSRANLVAMLKRTPLLRETMGFFRPLDAADIRRARAS